MPEATKNSEGQPAQLKIQVIGGGGDGARHHWPVLDELRCLEMGGLL